MFILELIVSFVITYSIGLIPPLIIRYWINKAPMNKRNATITAVIFGFINILIFTLLKGEAASPAPIFIIGSVSIIILTAESEKKKKNDNENEEVSKKPRSLESIYKLTGNVSIILAFVGLFTGMIIGYKPENFLSDLVVSLIYNFPRFFFGLKLRNQNKATADVAIRISKGMFIYSVVVAIINFIPVLIGSSGNLMVGWIYYILIYLYYRSYKESAQYLKNIQPSRTEKVMSIGDKQEKRTIPNNSIYILLAVIACLGLSLGFVLSQNKNNTSKNVITEYKDTNNVCDFEISDISQYKVGGDPEGIEKLKNEYEANENDGNTFSKYFTYSLEREIWEYENYRWFYYDGLIRNISDKEQYLININAKLRTSNNIFIDEGWSARIKRSLAPGEAIPFKVTIKVDSEDLVKKYIENDAYTLKTDFYPWFETCTY